MTSHELSPPPPDPQPDPSPGRNRESSPGPGPARDPAPDWVRRLEAVLAGSGLFVRGAFHPSAADGVPALADGRAAGTVILIGNAGNALWRAFRADGPDMAARHPLDSWVAGWMRAAAAALDAAFVDPMKPPFPPIQRWALRAGAGHRAPINLIVHPEYGLWHSFRGALLTAAALTLPEWQPPDNPCTGCAGRPCLTTCPAGAFALPPDGRTAAFDPAACVDHVEAAAGRGCRSAGCLARRACPVGRAWAYDREPAAYHMAAVVGTVRRWQARDRTGARAGDGAPTVPASDGDDGTDMTEPT